MFKKSKPLKRTALKLDEKEIKGVKKGAKMYSISENHYKRGAIRMQLQEDGLLPK